MTNIPLSEAVKYIRGITFKPEDIVEPGTDGSAVCMRTKNIQVELDESDLIAVSKSFIRRDDLYLQDGDILISSANSWDLVGKCCMVKNLKYDATAGGFISIVRGNPDVVNPNYLYRWLSSYRIRHKIKHLGRQTTNISNLPVDQFLDVEIPLPKNIKEQERVAAILDKADDICSKRQQAIQLADDYLYSMFLNMFGDPVTNPKGWTTTPFGEWANLLTGYPFQSFKYVSTGSNTIKLCRGANVLPGRLDWLDTVYWPETSTNNLEQYWLKEGDIVLALDRPWISSGLKVAKIENQDTPSLLVQRVARIRGESPAETIFFIF